jgi:hypothetical protein
LDIENTLGNPSYTPTTLTKQEILGNHWSSLCSFGILSKDEELDLLSLYWIPKLHACSYIAGSVSQMVHETSFQLLIYSISGQNRASALLLLATQWVVWIISKFWRTRRRTDNTMVNRKKDKMINNNLQNTTQKTIDWAKGIIPNT